MINSLIDLMQENLFLAVILSIIINIIIAIIGILPSYFITFINVTIFGYVYGFLVSVVGESLGALVSFWLYRKGFYKSTQKLISKNEKFEKLANSTDVQAFTIIFMMRVLPYMPSGIVTYLSAVTNVKIYIFTIASTLGKIPSLIIEILVSFSIISAAKSSSYELIFTITAVIVLAFMILKRIRK